MSPGHFEHVREIFAEASKLAGAECRAYLDEACGDDAELRSEVESLLEHDDAASDFLDPESIGVLADDPTPERIGKYRITGTLGRGGMGVVYRAEQTDPVRTVALKVIKPGMDSRRVIARFKAEMQAMALMDHPCVAKIFDSGLTEDERPYFVMEYVPGLPITKHCQQHNLDLDQRLGLFMQVCDAVQHAHQKGIIHRDIKPGNVLVVVDGDTTLPKVIDFGVAKALHRPLTVDSLISYERQLIGTPEYMSPEQAAMKDVDTRSDIYSLGVMLYELLTGVLPFDRESLHAAAFAEILRIVREVDPPKPSTRVSSLGAMEDTVDQPSSDLRESDVRSLDTRSLARRLRGDLDWITMKALEKDRNRRYTSASDLAAYIQKHLDGEAIDLGPPSAAYRISKFVRRHRTGVAAVAVVAAALVISTGVSIGFAISEAAQREAAEWKFFLANIYAADVALRNNEIVDAKRRLSLTPVHQRNWEWNYLHAKTDQSIATVPSRQGSKSVVFSPDGTQLAYSSDDKTIRIWDAITGKETVTLEGHEDYVMSIAFSPDGTSLASASIDTTVRLWDTATGDLLATMHGHTKHVQTVAFSPDGARIASGSRDRTTKIWDAATGKERATLRGRPFWVGSVAFSPDGARLATAYQDGVIELWNTATGKVLFTLRGHELAIGSIAFSPDGSQLASASLDSTIRLWDVLTGEELKTLRGHHSWVHAVAFSPDGTRLASGSLDTTIGLWNVETGQALGTLRGHEVGVNSVAFSPDGTRIVSASGRDDRGTIKLWDVLTGDPVTLHRHRLTFKSIAFSPDGATILSTAFYEPDESKGMKLWDVATRDELITRSSNLSGVFSPDGTRIASADLGTIRLWDATTGKQLAELRGHEVNREQIAPRPLYVHSVAFSPDGRRLASGASDNTIKLWDTVTGEELRTLSGHDNSVLSVTFSPDGTRLASGSRDKTIKLWDATTGKPLHTLRRHEGYVHCVTFSPDGAQLASASADRTIRLWNVDTGEELAMLEGHNGGVGTVAFSPDGTRLASGSYDTTVRLWDVATGEQLITLRGHKRSVSCVAFSPDGTRIASASVDWTIKFWDSVPWRQRANERDIAIQAVANAQPVVDRLFAELTEPKRVVEAFRQLDTISNADRQAALKLILKRASATDNTQADGILNREDAEWQSYLANIYAADIAVRNGEAVTAKHRLGLAPDHLHNWEWGYLSGKTDQSGATLRGHENGIVSVAFSPDGTRLASGSLHRIIKLWDTATGEELATLPRPRYGPSPVVAFSPDGTRLASVDTIRLRNSSLRYTIKLRDIATGEELVTLPGHEEAVFCVAFSPDSTRLASGSRDKTIKLWNTVTGEKLATLPGHAGGVMSAAFFHDGSRLAAGSWDEIKLWDTATGQELATMRGHGNLVYSVAFSPDGTRLASGGRDNTVKLWDTATGEELATLRGHAEEVRSVAFSPDGTRLASASFDRTIKLWDTATGHLLATLPGHEDRVSSVAFSPDGTRLASGSRDKTIKLWDSATGEELATLPGHEDRVSSVAFSPDGPRLASGSRDKTIKLWDTATGEELATLSGHDNYVLSVAFSPDGARLASGSRDKTIKLWDTATGEELATLSGHDNYVLSVAFSPDGARLASGSWDRTIKLWDTATGDELATLPGHKDGIGSVAFSPDGARLASGGRDKTIKLWDTATGEELATLRGHAEEVNSVAFSHDGTRLVSGSWDRTIKLWDTATGDELATLPGHKDGIGSVALSPDGTRLASGSWDRTIKLWDTATGDELVTLRGHENAVESVAFSSDGTRLASGSGDGSVKLWDSAPRRQRVKERDLAIRAAGTASPLVDRLFEELGEPADVADAIRNDDSLSDALRQAALNLVLKRAVDESNSARSGRD